MAYQTNVANWLKAASRETDVPVLIKPKAKYRGTSWNFYRPVRRT